MANKKVCIDPITRLEGHGKIEIYLDDDGKAEDAVFQTPELRGFERFCKGRRAEDMPRITERICGVCPEAHHFASTKALDQAYNTEPTARARALRELIYNAYIFADHLLHLFYLGGPDFLTKPDTPKEKRNILGVIEEVGGDIAGEVIKHRKLGHRIIEIIGGHEIHPVNGIPGGVSKAIDEEELEEIQQASEECQEFTLTAADLLKEKVFGKDLYTSLAEDQNYSMDTYYMGLVDKNSKVSFYDGKVRVVDSRGEEFALAETGDALDLLEEHVEPWTYVKFPYLKEIGWKGFQAGPENGIFRVGPLARLNVSRGMKTENAQREYDNFTDYFGNETVNQTFAYHWARLVELVQAAERMVEISSDDKTVLKGDLRNIPEEPGEGTGVIEAARGTLFHNYELDEDGIIKSANMIVPTTSNNAALSMSIQKTAEEIIDGKEIDDRILNQVERGFRPYDPCLACASHTVDGGLDIEVAIYKKDGELVDKFRRS